MSKNSNLVWIDLEMTGLDVQKDVIVEAALIITDSDLNVIATGPSLIIYQSEEALSVMGPWVKNQHTKSGLIEQVQKSIITLEQAEDQFLEVVQQFCVAKKSPLCGNTVWQDAIFLQKYMPRLMDYLHYRIIDVSSIKEVVKRWYPDSKKAHFVKSDTHRALTDIEESIAELRHYRNNFFV